MKTLKYKSRIPSKDTNFARWNKNRDNSVFKRELKKYKEKHFGELNK